MADLDEKQVNAVATRIELDLRIGYAFTRFITNNLRPMRGPMENLVISYGAISPMAVTFATILTYSGSCQFPTLGFVVDRYFRVKNFVPEPFWSIKVMLSRDSKKVNFTWARNRLFDRFSVVILYERCLAAKSAKVTKVQERPTRKFKPLPLTTVELQKAATRLLRMNGQQAMNIAEGLYNKGFISYPRTETDRFDKGINLKALVEKQTSDQRWGQFSQGLVNGGFQQPREGRHDDKAHPPIHPITYATPTVLNHDEGRLYEYVVRRFLACCSDDAKGVATDIEIQYGDEGFSTHGVIVLERNYLDVFIYDKWENSAELPRFTMGERFEPTEAMMTEGKTSPPTYLTEADLIALMDANGIGTDATMAEHIQKIQDREYVATVERGDQAPTTDEDTGGAPAARQGRGGRGGRGRRGRGGAASTSGRGGIRVFVPTKLGVALILGFDRMNFDTSLGKPFLRKEMELKMKAICDGQTTKEVVLRESIAQYQRVFYQSQENLHILKSASIPLEHYIRALANKCCCVGLPRICVWSRWLLDHLQLPFRSSTHISLRHIKESCGLGVIEERAAVPLGTMSPRPMYLANWLSGFLRDKEPMSPAKADPPEPILFLSEPARGCWIIRKISELSDFRPRGFTQSSLESNKVERGCIVHFARL